MADIHGSSPTPGSSIDPLQQHYYLHDGGGVIGPISGEKLKDMIEGGVVKRDANVNIVGEPNWIPIEQHPPFSGFFPAGRPAAAVGRPRPAAAAGEAKFASFWIRAAAYAIDYVLTLGLVTIAAVIFAIVSVTLFGQPLTEEWLDAHNLAVNVAGTAIALAYYAYFSAGPWQATPGKRICGIYLIRTNGQRVDAAFAVLRDVAYIVSALPLFIGFLMVFWSDERKALHDILCGTRVVYGRL